MNTLKLAQTMTAKRLTLSIAESCTGGLISHTLTNIPGSSAFLMGSVVAYANEVKTRFLKVPCSLIKKNGAVSKPVAKALAEGARKRFKTNFALSTTGIAGPGGGTAQKPVGLVFIALASPERTIIKKCFFTGSRLSIKIQSSQTALGLLSRAVSRGF